MRKIIAYSILMFGFVLFLGSCQVTADPIEELQTEGNMEPKPSRGGQHHDDPPE